MLLPHALSAREVALALVSLASNMTVDRLELYASAAAQAALVVFRERAVRPLALLQYTTV
jgi:hypothetical protein